MEKIKAEKHTDIANALVFQVQVLDVQIDLSSPSPCSSMRYEKTKNITQ